jgi:DNA repair exonuclease SbcCD ATPase subunit
MTTQSSQDAPTPISDEAEVNLQECISVETDCRGRKSYVDFYVPAYVSRNIERALAAEKEQKREAQSRSGAWHHCVMTAATIAGIDGLDTPNTFLVQLRDKLRLMESEISAEKAKREEEEQSVKYLRGACDYLESFEGAADALKLRDKLESAERELAAERKAKDLWEGDARIAQNNWHTACHEIENLNKQLATAKAALEESQKLIDVAMRHYIENTLTSKMNYHLAFGGLHIKQNTPLPKGPSNG